jgi:hypothetical protein
MFNLQVKLALWGLRFWLWFLDIILDEKPLMREWFFPRMPDGMWHAYCSFHAVERKVFSLKEERMAEAASGCH